MKLRCNNYHRDKFVTNYKLNTISLFVSVFIEILLHKQCQGTVNGTMLWPLAPCDSYSWPRSGESNALCAGWL